MFDRHRPGQTCAGPVRLEFVVRPLLGEWKGSLFVGALVGQQLVRIVLSPAGLPIRRDSLLTNLGQRIREVRQGPDGLVYLLTDEQDGALLRLEPASEAH